MDRTTWWLWRGARTRSLPELGRENPQRPWYCGSSHGRVGRRQVFQSMQATIRNQHTPPRTADKPGTNAGWSSPVARQAHNLKVTGSNPVPATRFCRQSLTRPPASRRALPGNPGSKRARTCAQSEPLLFHFDVRALRVISEPCLLAMKPGVTKRSETGQFAAQLRTVVTIICKRSSDALV
jgi:hypothetical protein